MNETDLTVSIVSFNTKDSLEMCVRSVLKHAGTLRLAVVVVDNASSDGSAEMIRRKFPSVRLIENPTNVYFSKAHNQAFAATNSELFLILNSDIEIRGPVLERMIDCMGSRPDVGAVAAQSRSADGRIQRHCSKDYPPKLAYFNFTLLGKLFGSPAMALNADTFYQDWDRTTSREVDVIPDSMMMVRRQDVARMGELYDEGMSLYFTENDLCRRLRQIGRKIFYLAEGDVVHLESVSVRQVDPQIISRIYRRDIAHYFTKYHGLLTATMLGLGIEITRGIVLALQWSGLRQFKENLIWGTRERSLKGTGRSILINLPVWDPTYRLKNVGKLIHRLLDRKSKVTVFCKETPELGDLRSLPGVSVESYRPPESRFFSFLKTILTHRFELVLWTYSSYRENILLAIAKRFGRLGFVLKHDSYIPPEPRGMRSVLSSAVYKWIIRSADLNVVESSSLKDWIAKLVPATQIVLMPIGVPISAFEKLKNEFSMETPPTPRPFFLYTGRVVPQKGLDLLIESFSQIADQLPDWDLRVVGPVRDASFHADCVHRIRACGLEERIILHGFQSDKELYRWYHFSSIFVLPSREEGLPNVVTDAMFFHNPIVAYRVGQIMALIDSSVGVLVSPHETASFAGAMKNLAENAALRKSLGANAHQKVVQDHDDNVLFARLFEKLEL